jgi:hypothetical protein
MKDPNQQYTYITRDFDHVKSPANYHGTVAEVARKDMNGGMTAISLWAVPLIVAIILLIWFFWHGPKGAEI